ncbi:phosphoglycerate kinase [Candidatus Parcubacteria bacterium]|nr:MAG: phosphoglycerate kinase [Candidatus Parcubacteria bacterium]
MNVKTIKNIKDLKGKKVFLRADFNVPIKNNIVRDDFKIVSSLPTIRHLRRYGAKIILASHLGKPGGEYNSEYSLKPVATRISRLLGARVNFIPGEIGLEAETAVGKMKPGDIILLDNLRFNKGEEKNSKTFARRMAKLADIYVNNAFAVSHRAHASVSAMTNYLPVYSGLLLEKELINLNKILKPKHPLILVMGGSKIGTKIKLVKKLHKNANKILVGGALANNFLLARGYKTGESLIDRDSIKFAKSFKSKKIIIPIDVVVKNKLTGKINSRKLSEIESVDAILDIGPETIRLFSSFIKRAATVIWNGPMGMYESPRFKAGTMSIGQVIASKSTGKAFGLVGGGETVEALKKTKMQDHVDWVSTGGGAMLSYLGGEKMPGLKKIINK